MTATPDAFKDIAPLLTPSYSTLPFPLPLFTTLASAGILISADATVEPHLEKSSLGSTTLRFRSRRICRSVTILRRVRRS